METSTKAVSYMRCSSDGQVLGDTWERQRTIILKYASTNYHEMVSEFRDEGVTGKMELENRAGLSACMQFIQANGIKIVLVESSDRLARDMIVAEVIVREFQKIGVRVIATSGGVDLTAGDDLNPTAKLIRQILASIAEFDRCVTVLKLRGARARKRMKDGMAKGFTGEEALKNGKCEGQKSFGEKPEEKQALGDMIVWHRAGLTCQAIAANLNSAGFKTRSGKPWHRSTVAKILARDRSQSSPRVETQKMS
jgi:DNA invertase Pin-like site-specific DNA recombinase